MVSLQKESEWEKEWSKKKNEILGLFNAGQHHLLTQNGSVNLTASQQREEGKYNCRDAKKAVDRTEEFFLSVLSNQEKEIAEEVPNALHEYARWILTDGKNAGPLQRRGKKKEITLQILKHLYKSNSSGLPIADNRMQLGISRVKSAEDYQKYGIKPDSDDLQ